MKISVVVPTMNRDCQLDMMLGSLATQSMDKSEYEVLVIDNGSVDETKTICEKYRSVFPNYEYIYCSAPGLHNGRNEGYLRSKADFIVYADDDIIVGENWLVSIFNAFIEDDSVALVGGNVIPLCESERVERWIAKYWVDIDESTKWLPEFCCIDIGKCKGVISPYFVFGCNFAIRKSILEDAKGFHPDGVPDELLVYRGDGESYVSEYIMKRGLLAVFEPEASVLHSVTELRATHKYVRKSIFRGGISYAYSLLRNSDAFLIRKQVWSAVVKTIYSPNGTRLLSMYREFYRIKGMLFLYRNYRKNDKVKEWVSQEHYLGEMGIIK